jgi:RES domain-containing protein
VIEVWRLVRMRFCATTVAAFSGEGAALAGGRWNRKGTRVAYASWSRSLAILEILATIERAEAPTDYAFASASFAEEDVFQLPPLPPEWRRPARSGTTVEIGERFVAEGRALALAIPSVVVPQEFNYIINPLHARFGAIEIGKSLEPFAFDSRIFTLRTILPR